MSQIKWIRVDTGGLLGSTLVLFSCSSLLLLSVLATVFRARTGLKQRDNLDNKHRDNGNVCLLLLCCWLSRVPLGQCFKSDNAEKQTPKIADYSTFLNERPRLNFLGYGYFVIYSITRQNGHALGTPNKQNT